MHILHQIHSKNYDLRPNIENPIRFVVIHYTEMGFDDSVQILSSPSSKVSCHYLIRKNGNIYQLVGDFYRAWHAGVSKWQKYESLNDYSIGIELENLGNEEFTNEQYNSLIQLLEKLRDKYKILNENIIGHSDIAPARKVDPGIFFNWNNLQKFSLGIRYRNPRCTYKKIELDTENIPFLRRSLKKMGYDVDISNCEYDKNLSNTIRAFQIHFSQNSIFKQGGLDILKDKDFDYSWDNFSQLTLNDIVNLNI